MRDLAILTLVCAVVYFTGLDRHGVANWQEGQRLAVAREMAAKGEWVVPSLNGRAYLAKPPMVYWLTMGAARLMPARSGAVELWHLRFVVASAGLAGVLVTYGAARSMTRCDEPLGRGAGSGGRGGGGGERKGRGGEEGGRGTVACVRGNESERFARACAMWSALALATGVLYVRSSRIGELDVVLVALVAGANWAVFAAWKATGFGERAWGGWSAAAAGAAACACAAGAGLAKGPAGLVCVVAGPVCGMAVHAIMAGGQGRGGAGRTDVRWWINRRWAVGVIAGVGVAVLSLGRGRGVGLDGTAAAGIGLRDIAGAVVLGTSAGYAAFGIAALATTRAGIAFARSVLGSHAIPALCAGVFSVWAWGRLVADRIGMERVREFAGEEADDNLRVLEAGSIVTNLEALSYGVCVGSVAAIAGLVWMVREKPRVGRGVVVAAAWMVCGVLAYSVLGKGVARYLTPVWPGVAIVGGFTIASWLRDSGAMKRDTRRAVVLISIVIAGAAQAWWYGWGRAGLQGDRTPREFVEALERAAGPLDADDLVTLEFRTPALDYYVGGTPGAVGAIGQRESIAGLTPMSYADFAALARAIGARKAHDGGVERVESGQPDESSERGRRGDSQRHADEVRTQENEIVIPRGAGNGSWGGGGAGTGRGSSRSLAKGRTTE